MFFGINVLHTKDEKDPSDKIKNRFCDCMELYQCSWQCLFPPSTSVTATLMGKVHWDSRATYVAFKTMPFPGTPMHFNKAKKQKTNTFCACGWLWKKKVQVLDGHDCSLDLSSMEDVKKKYIFTITQYCWTHHGWHRPPKSTYVRWNIHLSTRGGRELSQSSSAVWTFTTTSSVVLLVLNYSSNLTQKLVWS